MMFTEEDVEIRTFTNSGFVCITHEMLSDPKVRIFWSVTMDGRKFNTLTKNCTRYIESKQGNGAKCPGFTWWTDGMMGLTSSAAMHMFTDDLDDHVYLGFDPLGSQLHFQFFGRFLKESEPSLEILDLFRKVNPITALP